MDNFTEFTKTWEQFKGVLDVQEKELKKYGEVTIEIKNYLEKLNNRLDELEVKLNRPPTKGSEGKPESEAEIKAFVKFMRKDIGSLSPEEMKLLATDVDFAGGYFLPSPVQGRIIEKLVEFSPIRQLATVETITLSNTLQLPVDEWLDEDTEWEGERTATPPPPEDRKYAGLKTISVHPMGSRPRATLDMLEDAGFDLEGWLVRKTSQKLGRKEGTAFVIGNGVAKPEGLLTATGVTEVNTGHASQLTPVGLIRLETALPEFYARNAVFLMKRATRGLIREMKDLQDRFIWDPGIRDAVPPTILGYPYVECIDMPVVGAGTFPIIFGDIRAAYTILDKGGISVTRDPFSVKPKVEFYTRKRVGGQVVLAEAMVKQKVSA